MQQVSAKRKDIDRRGPRHQFKVRKVSSKNSSGCELEVGSLTLGSLVCLVTVSSACIGISGRHHPDTPAVVLFPHHHSKPSPLLTGHPYETGCLEAACTETVWIANLWVL